MGTQLFLIIVQHHLDNVAYIYNNTGVFGGVIYILDNTIITLHPTILQLLSMETTTLTSTQQVMVVQSTLLEVLFTSVEPATLSTIQQLVAVAQSAHQQLLLASLEPAKLINNIAYGYGGTVKFTNNACGSGSELNGCILGGGGLYMGLKSTFSILPNTSVYWKNNHASLGGAMFKMLAL